MLTAGRLWRSAGGPAAATALALATLIGTGASPAQADIPHPAPAPRPATALPGRPGSGPIRFPQAAAAGGARATLHPQATPQLREPAAVQRSAQPSGQSYGPASGLHMQVLGSASAGYRAEVYDGNTFVTGRGMQGPWDVTVNPTVNATQTLSCTLAASNTCSGMAQDDFAGDGVTTPVTVAGESGRETVQVVANDLNMYFNVDDNIAYDGSYAAVFTVEYYDGGTNGWTLDYDSTNPNGGPLSGAYTPAGSVTESGSDTWKTATFSVPDARFADRENGGNDFRIASNLPVTIHSVSVQVTGQLGGNTTELQNKYTNVSYFAATQTLTLSGAVDDVQGTTVTRSESYRFVDGETIAAMVSIESDKAATAWYSAYTDFPASWQTMWAGGYSGYYDSPLGSDTNQDSPVPVLGASNGQYVYGVASAATWDYPVPGYNTPHLVISGNRLAAPQMGTQANPILLSPGTTNQWESVIFRSAGSPTPYGMEIGGEAAMAKALGFTTQNSPALSGAQAAQAASLADSAAAQVGDAQEGGDTADRLLAAQDFGLIMRATAYWLREAPGGSGTAVAPSTHYSPGTYMRDSFWGTLAMAGTPQFATTEQPVFTAFTNSIPVSGAQAGHVPVTVGGPEYPDESGLLYLIRMYDDAVVHGLPVANTSVAGQVLAYIQANQVSNGAFVTAAPASQGGFTISPDTWLDGYLYPAGAISAYDQGLYVVALQAAQKLGLAVTSAQVSQAIAVYQSLYDPQLGYVKWLSTTTYKGPDVLTGDALSLLLFGQALLPDAEVASTLAHQDWTANGMAVLATQDNQYVPAGQFETLELSDSGQVVGTGEPGGWYQNGGSWFLYEYLAEWAAAKQGDPQAQGLMTRSIADEVADTPMSKEFKLTTTDPSYPYPAGSSEYQRQGYGWNAAYVTFARDWSPAGGTATTAVRPATSRKPTALAAPRAPAGSSYGPPGGMHVVVTGTPATGLAAVIADGSTLVSKRGMDGTDITVNTTSGPVALQNHYTSAAYNPQTATLTLSGAADAVAGTTLTRWESYRFTGPETVQALVGVSASGGSAVNLYYSPYTDFPSDWRALRPIENDYQPANMFTSSYSSTQQPLGAGGAATDQYGVPLLGVYSGNYIYGVASGSTWQYPVDGYGNPHLTIDGSRLGAPQIGDAASPISLAPGASRQWMQVFYRAAPDAYDFQLGGEVAMAQALGYTARSSPGVSGPLDPDGLPAAPVTDPQGTQQAMGDWGLVLDATAYWDLQTTLHGVRTVVPSEAYTPDTYMRDSFWTLLGLQGSLGDQAEQYVMQMFNANVIQTGQSAGTVPTYVAPPDSPGYGQAGNSSAPAAIDESNLLYIIRMYYDADVRHLSGVLNLNDASLALQYMLNNRVVNNQVMAIVPNFTSWLDTGTTPLGSVDTYSQGLFVVALMAAQKLGLSVTDTQISAAQAAYAALYSPADGYLPWNNAPGLDYRAPSVLAGEAWSLFLFNKSILPTPVVASTLHAQSLTPYGEMDISAAGGGYLLDYSDPSVFLQGIGDLDAPGHYQNGGDWYLFDYWAAYAGERLGVPGASGLISWDTGRQLAVDPTSHEYTLTNPFVPGAPYTEMMPMSAPAYRQGYGWNAAFNAFAPTASLPVG